MAATAPDILSLHSSIPSRKEEEQQHKRPSHLPLSGQREKSVSHRLSVYCPVLLNLEGFDSVVSSTEKLSHPTTSRPKATGRRPPSQSLTSVSDNKASLPPKPGTMAAGGGGPAPLSSAAPSPLSSSLGTAGHRANSPSLFSTEGKPKMEPAAVEELRTQVRELRSIIETMKDQQKREIKQLLSELDEEKKIRLRLQMEVNDIKKALQSK
nr:SH3 domain-containing kinase-binding protein 1-like [Gorilla gorilla gorilla]